MINTQEVLYHYTTLEVFVNIIKSKKFRLCDVTKSNDPLEGIYMIQSLEDAYYRLYHDGKIGKEKYIMINRAFFRFREMITNQGRNRDFYGAASFCIPSHELLMLRSYADNGNGVALGVPITVLETLAKNDSHLEFKKIEYLSNEEITEKAREFWINKVDKWMNELSIRGEEALSTFADEIKDFYRESYFIKNKVNEDEQEYRLLYKCDDLFGIYLPGVDRYVPENIDFIQSDDDLKAYYEITVGDGDDVPFHFCNIVIGPKCNATEEEINVFMRRHGIKDVSVFKNSWTQMR